MANDIRVPHFNIPFRFRGAHNGGCAVEVEQDTSRDISNCVEAIIRTPRGWRDEAPYFGMPDLLFKEIPVMTADVRQMIRDQEPRADIVFTEDSPERDELLRIIEVAVTRHGGDS